MINKDDFIKNEVTEQMYKAKDEYKKYKESEK